MSLNRASSDDDKAILFLLDYYTYVMLCDVTSLCIIEAVLVLDLLMTMSGIMSAVSGVASDQAQFGSEQSFSKEVDDKANSYFQAIYNRGMSVDRLLDELKKFKDSPVKKDRVI